MKQLNQIMGIDYNIVIDTIEDDSRVEQPNGLFFSIEGINRDGHNYVEEAIQNGVKETYGQKHKPLLLGDVIQNGVKETQWRRVDNHPTYLDRIIKNYLHYRYCRR